MLSTKTQNNYYYPIYGTFSFSSAIFNPPQLCFAYLVNGDLPPLVVDYTAYKLNETRGTLIDVRGDFEGSSCQGWPTIFTSQWDYVCINLLQCLFQIEGLLFNPTITRIKFNYRNTQYWIDEVRLSRTKITGNFQFTLTCIQRMMS